MKQSSYVEAKHNSQRVFLRGPVFDFVKNRTSQNRVWVCAIIILASVILGSCGQVAIRIHTPVPTQPALSPQTESNAPPQQPQPSDSGWLPIEEGVELRRMRVLHNTRLSPIHIVRLNPAFVSFHIAYTPDLPQSMATWCHPPNVLGAINGGFFEANYHTTALIISDGITYGSSYEGQGGMFAVDTNGTTSLRSLAEQPYNAEHEFVQNALQGWPMLIFPGSRLAYTNPDGGDTARRSVIAQDRAGNILLLAFAGSDFTLHDLAAWLLASDMDIDAAFNLDGGSSTGLCLNGQTEREMIDAFGPLPSVLIVRRK